MTELQASGLKQDRSLAKPARMLVWTVGAVFLFGLFLFLGTWQAYRLSWKLDLIERVETRLHSAPAAAPMPSAWPDLDVKDSEYQPVKLAGEFDHSKQALVQATTDLGAGHWVLTPLRTADGWWVWVNRGFVPPSRQMQSGLTQPAGAVQLTALLRQTEPKGGFLRENDPLADRWHSRDVAALSARHLAGEAVAPYFVDERRAANTPEGQLPVAGLTVVQFKNNHLVYLLTWYALALMVVGAWFLVRKHLNRPAGAQDSDD